MITDNRPKTHPKKKARHAPAADAVFEPVETVHIRSEAPVPALPEPRAAKPARKKAALPGGLGGLLGGGQGGGIGSVLPILLIAGALQRGRSPAPAARQIQPAIPAETGAQAAEINAATARSAANERRGKPGKLAVPPPPKPETAPAPAAAQTPAAQRPPIPLRRAPQPTEIKNLLSDLAGYLPGTGGAQASRIARVIGLADEMKSLNTPGDSISFAQPADPLDRQIGLLSALGRNLPFAGASSLGRASQMLTMVSTLRGSGGQGLGNMAGVLRNAMSPAQPEMKNITPEQADGIKSTVNRLLSGMDDKQKDALLSKAKDFLGKK